MRNVIVIIFALISACATTPKPVAGNLLEGIWLGRWTDIINNSTGDVQVSMVNNQYTIDYPSLRCGGTLTQIGHDSRKIEFRQNLTYGLSNCPRGKSMKMVTTTTGENRAEVEWYTQWGLVWWERKIGTGEFSRLTQEQLAQIQASRSKSEGISPGAAILWGVGALLILNSLSEGGSPGSAAPFNSDNQKEWYEGKWRTKRDINELRFMAPEERRSVLETE